jgi:hypothetical protein
MIWIVLQDASERMRMHSTLTVQSSTLAQSGCSFNIGQLTTKLQLEIGKCEISVKEA